MKKRYLCLLTVPFLVAPIVIVSSNNSSASADQPETIGSTEEEPEVYSASKDFPGADGNYEQVKSSGRYPWNYQALNVRSFYEEGLVNVDSATGQLTLDEYNQGLQMFSTFRNTQNTGGDATVMYPGHDKSNVKEIDKLYAYPAGYKTAYDDSNVSLASNASYTASQQWFGVGGGQWIHPGYNVAVAICFFAPKAGTIKISDSIYIPSEGYESDGIDLAIYKVPNEYILYGRKLWSVGDAFGLYGGTPIYPTPGVNIGPAPSYQGWKHIDTKQDVAYETGEISVEKEDMIVFLYSQHGTTTCDTTYTSPTITYVTKKAVVTLDRYNEPISINETLQLTATITDGSKDGENITWTSEDPTIATVSNNGLVTGVKAGTTRIWATLDNGSKAYCLFKVRNKTV